MKTRSLSILLFWGLLAGRGPLTLAAQAADSQTPAGPAVTAPAQDQARPAGGKSDLDQVKRRLKAMSVSPGLQEVMELKKAGVEDAVVLSYIQSSTVAYRPSAQEILQLRENGFTSDMIVAILQRGGQLRQQAAETASSAPAPAAPEPAPAQAPAVYYPPAVYAPVAAPTVVYAGYPSYGYSYGYGYGYGYHPGFYPRYYSSCYPRFGFSSGCYPGISVGVRLGGGHFGGSHFGGFRGGIHRR